VTRDEIRTALLEEIGNIAPEADLGQLSPKIDFREELDIDSIGFLNLVIAIGKRIGRDVPEADYGRLSTLDGAVDYLAGLG
jgi:acyl carrier protein